MKRIEIATTTNAPHFIGSWFIEPAGSCDDLIALFDPNGDSQKGGKTYDGLNEDNKKSTDLTVLPRQTESCWCSCSARCMKPHMERRSGRVG